MWPYSYCASSSRVASSCKTSLVCLILLMLVVHSGTSGYRRADNLQTARSPPINKGDSFSRFGGFWTWLKESLVRASWITLSPWSACLTDFWLLSKLLFSFFPLSNIFFELNETWLGIKCQLFPRRVMLVMFFNLSVIWITLCHNQSINVSNLWFNLRFTMHLYDILQKLPAAWIRLLIFSLRLGGWTWLQNTARCVSIIFFFNYTAIFCGCFENYIDPQNPHWFILTFWSVQMLSNWTVFREFVLWPLVSFVRISVKYMRQSKILRRLYPFMSERQIFIKVRNLRLVQTSACRK